MSTLNNLINSCQQYIKTNHPILKNVKRPALLVRYLKELKDDVIDNYYFDLSVTQKCTLIINLEHI